MPQHNATKLFYPNYASLKGPDDKKVTKSNRDAFVRNYHRETSNRRNALSKVMKELEHRSMSPSTIQRKLNQEGVNPRSAEISLILRHFETSSHAYNTQYFEQDD